MAEQNLTKLAYLTLQQGKSLAGLAHKGLSTKLMEFFAPEAIPQTTQVGKDLLEELRKSMAELEKTDWNEAELGLYPKSLLFEAPWLEWFAKYPLVWLDMPSTWNRRRKNNIKDLPKDVNKTNYPEYYLQNFHHQTDGYLSDYSAEIYDIQVEILFNGTADSMRRRIIAPLNKGLNKFKNNHQSNLKVIDIATGTGRTLQQLRIAFPKLELLGLDLSGAYLKKASKYLNNREGDMVQLIKGNAEKVPLPDDSVHGISCVFLFHELPRQARQNVINECFRILQPGGTIVIADSIQMSDSPEFIPVMENFRKIFHEPYYLDYVKDDINQRMEDAGFIDLDSKSHFMTRVWSAEKPI
ncbi:MULTISPECIES: class I SAM-dependent methyltransferase [Prochlorococcus]|uniref:class I SAM-dependent methyltransferase n=1 Tax=Prochlorococcus TaxID=1218 RepID=UPI0005337851|nr:MULTISPECIES: class I SAM-dependent methyltransferase [Prochlorococcus]KGG12317.1 SAM-dependent methyltransferase [Prochlorococcus sp. MIT 0601]